MNQDFEVSGTDDAALFSLKLHRGDGMTLIAMDWKKGKPAKNFVGFWIAYKEPDGKTFYDLKNRLTFPDNGVHAEGAGTHAAAARDSLIETRIYPTKTAPIQKFRWIHFPRNAELEGKFVYRVTPVFMDSDGKLSYGTPQQADIELRRDTYPGKLNLAFTRGFVSSQAFVDKFGADSIPALLPSTKVSGLDFKPTYLKAKQALDWMGFEARSAVLKLLDQAIADKRAQVSVVLYDFDEPGILERLEKLGKRLRIIIDNEGAHKPPTSDESVAAERLTATAGAENVKRQHLDKLQHNKTVVVNGPKTKAVLLGSTNASWRGFFVQNNNAVIIQGETAVKIVNAAFENYWQHGESAPAFAASDSAVWHTLHIPGIDIQLGFFPRSAHNAALQSIADDIRNNTTSSLFFSLAFLYQTEGPILDAIQSLSDKKHLFCYGISDHAVKSLETSGVDLRKPNGNVQSVHPAQISGHIPPPFSKEPVGGSGTRMHHKFVVIDYNLPSARVYAGSYNFSGSADAHNGENLLLMRDRRIAVSYMVEALRIFDHYHFRVALAEHKNTGPLQLQPAPAKGDVHAWWEEYYSDPVKIADRALFR